MINAVQTYNNEVLNKEMLDVCYINYFTKVKSHERHKIVEFYLSI